MKTIIAPTDFSAVSLNAVNYAADFAVAINAGLLLLTVVQVPVPLSEIPPTGFEYEGMTEAAEQQLAELSNQLHLRTTDKIKIETKMMVGVVGYELKETCKTEKPFAVVMGTKSAGAVERFLLGSNTIFAIKNLEYPVLVVPHNVSFKEIKKIVLASDLKEIESIQSLASLVEWLQTFKSQFSIINVIEHSNIKPSVLPGSISLQNLLREFDPQFLFIDAENLEEGIDKFLEEKHPDLLVLIPRKHGMFEAIFHKSKSKPFIQHAPIPVLAIPEL